MSDDAGATAAEYIVELAGRAAECWAIGNIRDAERWLELACRLRGNNAFTDDVAS